MHKILMTRTGGPEVLEWVEAPDPTAGEGEIVVKTHASAVGWPDVLIRTGVYRWLPPLPLTPGNELTGHVTAVGSGVTGFHVGQPVYVASRELGFQSGCYTEQMAVRASAVQPLPAEIDLDSATNLGYYALAWALLHETLRGFTPKSALVIGAAGGVGSALVQTAHFEGMKVIGTVSSPEKAAFATSLGADHVINYRTENVLDRVLELTDGKGVDVILDAVAGPKFSDHFKMLDRWGTVVVYNATGGPPPADFFDAWRTQAGKSLGLRYFSMHVYEGDPEGRRRILTPVIEMLRQGVRAPIARRFPLQEAQEAHRYLESGASMGRILLQP